MKKDKQSTEKYLTESCSNAEDTARKHKRRQLEKINFNFTTVDRKVTN